jgi:1-deoxy-D-xylulose-5-phosphate reductoisomerase
MKKVVVLGASGSIGSSTLSIIRQFPEHYSLWGVSAHSSGEKIGAIADEFRPAVVVLGSDDAAKTFRERLPDFRGEILIGEENLCRLAAASQADLVVAAIVGVAGLRPVEAALQAGRRVLLANKESLVCAGAYLMEVAARNGAHLLPIDSEHSAIFQLMEGRGREDLASITLTASGGPFWRMPPEAFSSITPEQAVKHPRWSMGAKISVDSATLVNKALEVIEAAWLFSLPEDRIKIVIHPESIVHSLITFTDGVQFAQLSVPDMRGPIGYAMGHPEPRLAGMMAPLQLEEVGALTFAPLDDKRFPAPQLARSCLRSGGNAPAVFNLINERAVSLFLRGEIGFTEIVPLIERGLSVFFDPKSPEPRDVQRLELRLWEWMEHSLS